MLLSEGYIQSLNSCLLHSSCLELHPPPLPQMEMQMDADGDQDTASLDVLPVGKLLISLGCFSWMDTFPRTPEPAAAAPACLLLKGTASSPLLPSRAPRSSSSHACTQGAAGRKSEPGQLKIACLSEFSMRPLRILISPLLFWHGTSCRWSSLHKQRYLGHPKASCCPGRTQGHYPMG